MSWSGSPRGPRCHRRPLPAAGRSLVPPRKLGADCGPGAAAPRPPHLSVSPTRWWIRLWSSWAGSCHMSWSSSSEPRSRGPREEKKEAPRSLLCYKHGEFYHRSRSRGGMERKHSSWPRLCGVEECELLTPSCDRCTLALLSEQFAHKVAQTPKYPPVKRKSGATNTWWEAAFR